MSKKILKIFAWLLFLGLVAAFIFNFQTLKDFYLSLTFEPSAEIVSIKNDLNLTDRANMIFLASEPTLNGAKEFNSICNTESSDTSMLGCYTGQKIYLYDINSDELKGVKQSTAAHELLHAAWFRLSTADRENLIPTLESVYDKSDADFKKSLETYDESAKIEEIYVRSATQIKSLPENLEKHYAEYFKDQDKIVDYYNSYIKPFNEIQSRLDSLKAEMDALNEQIKIKSDEFDTRDSALSTAISEFNRCAETVNCFESDVTFHARRSELIAEQNSLNELSDSINADINLYNEKIAEYNKNVIHGEELNRIMNSNPQQTEEIRE